ncbi:MAG: nitrogen fixation protein FixI [Alphaproteobacteria bacterium HGW-Alphaproteobacteria-16]|nr:MAG: nitrogen fixation protein FixI [Alphaproteobacteria bacterium HGW-Alphaproteobacteria-16]
MNAPVSIRDGAALDHSSFSAPGIRCASCIAKIERGLADVPGIARARVNFTTRRVEIDHIPDLNPAMLRDAIAATGFDAHPVTVRTDERAETRTLMRAMAVAGFASMNVMLLSVSVWSGATGVTRDLFHWLSALIAMPAIAYAGRIFFKSAWQALRRGRTNMDVPISIGVLLATAMSLFETATSGPHAYFDGAIMLTFFLLVGRFLDSVMRDRARSGVDALLRQTAPGGLVLQGDGSTLWTAADALQPGMTLLIASGERIAADGVVEMGDSAVDRSLITGESAPDRVGVGDPVLAGTLNLDAPLTVRITAAGSGTTIAEIARLMDAAGQGRSRYVRIADRAARLYAPAVHLLAALSFAGWMIAGAGWHQSILIATAVLIITCPCALGLAVPAAQVVASGALMRRGILVKDGSALERLAEANHVCFDKTGTLTLGRPELIDLPDWSPQEAGAAMALAQSSRHPLSKALVATLHARGTRPAQVMDIQETPGVGMSGEVDGMAVRLVRPDAVGVSVTGDTALMIGFRLGDLPPRLLRFHDPLRPDTVAAIASLRAQGMASNLLSGDRTAAVTAVATELGLPAQGDLSPQDKLVAINGLQQDGVRVLMIGDGLNDGPALAAGHVSMAPASASDVGQNAADLVFMGDSLMPVPVAVRAARRTMAIVRQNFALAVIYNVFAVPLAIAGFVTPLIAALAMSLSSVLVVANALRLNGCAK